jgi:misacylated tRNA(Ala) deacylase
MVEELFRQDAYLKDAEATVTALDERGVRLDRSIFYPTGGGQPGDTGLLRWDGGEARIVDAVKADGADVLHVLAPDAPRPAVGTKVHTILDWNRRLLHMRMHTALHVMSAVIKGNVTGGQVGADKSRLDFNLDGEVPAKEWVTEEINKLIALDRLVTPQWITDEELAARPELVKTMSVRPPMGAGRVRLLAIEGIDLQACGGTHVARTGEIGRVECIKIENKGKMNRRFVIALTQPLASP